MTEFAACSSALDRINVRRLMIYIEKSISRAMQAFVFEPNSETTRSRVTSIIDGFFHVLVFSTTHKLAGFIEPVEQFLYFLLIHASSFCNSSTFSLSETGFCKAHLESSSLLK